MKEHNFEIRIMSDGRKITADEARHIFDPFFQLGDTNDKHGGVGLGLSVAHSLAEMHGGTLFLAADSHEENVFVLSLPFKSKDEKATQLLTNEATNYISLDDSASTNAQSTRLHAAIGGRSRRDATIYCRTARTAFQLLKLPLTETRP